MILSAEDCAEVVVLMKDGYLALAILLFKKYYNIFGRLVENRQPLPQIIVLHSLCNRHLTSVQTKNRLRTSTPKIERGWVESL